MYKELATQWAVLYCIIPGAVSRPTELITVLLVLSSNSPKLHKYKCCTCAAGVGALALAAIVLYCRLKVQIGEAHKPCSTMSSQTLLFVYSVSCD